MVEALAFLNKLDIVHRDIKSENILWVRSNNTDLSTVTPGNYKMCDFGVAAFARPPPR